MLISSCISFAHMRKKVSLFPDVAMSRTVFLSFFFFFLFFLKKKRYQVFLQRSNLADPKFELQISAHEASALTTEYCNY